jgi:hypothetical protein
MFNVRTPLGLGMIAKVFAGGVGSDCAYLIYSLVFIFPPESVLRPALCIY